jgi:hypothetical protein
MFHGINFGEIGLDSKPMNDLTSGTPQLPGYNKLPVRNPDKPEPCGAGTLYAAQVRLCRFSFVSG